ncbi:MAG TPA: hypothetical protein PKD99_05170 [Sphingopyxis sp.]|nr:hypothetical protein [Sphingopyxis sp.]HMP44477.1 hypothetical protein [Sphingopyxis sp.]HMQ19317.1 hypothetical protein [Sphingopyxis sp.]
MRAFIRTLAAAAGAAALAGCSFQGTLDKMVSPDRQKEIIDVGQRFCTDPVSNSRLLHPEIATSAQDMAPLLPNECPEGQATWQLASYQWNTNINNGLKQRQEDAVVVGTGNAKWTTVSLRFYAENDAPLQIVQWNVLGSTTKPEALTFIEQYEKGMKTAGIAGAILLLLVGGLVVWLVRRSRAKKAGAPPA